jgi:hypothetical protein
MIANELVEQLCFRVLSHQNPHRAIKAPPCSWNSTTAPKVFWKGSGAVLRELPFPFSHFVTDYSLGKQDRILSFSTVSTPSLSGARVLARRLDALIRHLAGC